MGLRDEIEAYVDANGQVNPGPVPKDAKSKTGNGIAYTAVYNWLLFKRQEARDPSISSDLMKVYSSCLVGGQKGLLQRSPDKVGDQDGWDDYICLLAAGAIGAMNLPLVSDIEKYGKDHLWCFNDEKPGSFSWKSFFGRNSAFIAHVAFANKKRPCIFYRIYWAIAVATAGLFDKTDATARVLSFMMIETMNGMSGICSFGAAVWSYRMKGLDMRRYIGLWLSIEKVNGKPVPNWGHPMVKYWIGQ